MRASRIVAAVLLVGVCLSLAATARGQENRTAAVRGKFVRLVEKTVGEREFLGIVVQLPERERQATVLFGRDRTDILRLARTLKPGQKVEIAAVKERDQMYVRRLEAAGAAERPAEREARERAERAERERREKAERERREKAERAQREGREKAERAERERREGVEGRGDLAELTAMVRRLAQSMERIERQLNELRAENARLREQLQRRDRPEGDRPRADRAARDGDRARGDAPERDRPREGR